MCNVFQDDLSLGEINPELVMEKRVGFFASDSEKSGNFKGKKFSGILEVDLAGKRLSKIETLAGSPLMRKILERFVTAPSSECLWLHQEMFDCM